MFGRLDYQDRVLAVLDAHIDLLKVNKREADEIAELAATKPHLNIPVPDFAEKAWEALKAERKLQSANRETKDTLKMFQDRGDVPGFFPPEGDQLAHHGALDDTPNLGAYRGMFPMVKDSLGNALRIIRPVVVLDEGHKAISDLAFRTLYGFNPVFVLELTATPRDVQQRQGKNPRPARYANLLVEVTGREIDREGMIKIPLNVDTRQGTDWRATLYTALGRLDQLDAAARTLRAETDRYIRPIMLVQVPRVRDKLRPTA